MSPVAPLESAVVRKIISYLRSRGAFAEKIHGSNMQPALLDVLVCYRGFFILLEVKRSANLEPTARQKYTIAKVQEAGGIACKVSSVDEVARILDEIDRGQNATTAS